MSVRFCIAAFDYDELLLLAQTEGERIPNEGEYVEIDFKDPRTFFVTGAWGKEGVAGRVFSFYVTPTSRLADWNKLAVLECQLACDCV
jgi:hypothetical protein